MTTAQQAQFLDHEEPPGAVYWITGLADCGKSTFARVLWRGLRNRGQSTILFDSDSLRKILGPKFGFNREDRRNVSTIYSQLCRSMSEQGFTVVCATVSMFDDIRQWNREFIPQYYEIYIRASTQTILERYPKGLYAAAKAGRVRNVPGVDQYAEAPREPDLIIDNDAEMSVEDLCEIAEVIAERQIERRPQL